MYRAFAVGVIAGVGYVLSDNYIPTTKSSMLDSAINLAVAGVFGAAAIHYLHKR